MTLLVATGTTLFEDKNVSDYKGNDYQKKKKKKDCRADLREKQFLDNQRDAILRGGDRLQRKGEMRMR